MPPSQIPHGHHTTPTNPATERAHAREQEGYTHPWERPWPRPWMPTFLQALSIVPDVTSACRHSGINKWTAYDHRKRNEEFADAWLEAIQYQRDNFERNLHRWATTGLPVEEERIDEEFDEKGQVVKRKTTVTRKAVRSERLAELWAKAWYGDRYRFKETSDQTLDVSVNLGSLDAIDREIARLTKELEQRATAAGSPPVPDEEQRETL